MEVDDLVAQDGGCRAGTSSSEKPNMGSQIREPDSASFFEADENRIASQLTALFSC